MLTLKEFTARYGKSKLSLEAYAYYLYLIQNKGLLTRPQIKQDTGLDIHRQIQIENLISDLIDKTNTGKGYFFKPKVEEEVKIIHLKKSSAVRKPAHQSKQIVAKVEKYQFENGMEVSTYQPVFSFKPEGGEDFNFEHIGSDMWKVTHHKYPDLEITLTKEQYELAKDNPKLLAYKFETLQYKKIKSQLEPPNPFQKYIDKLNDLTNKDDMQKVAEQKNNVEINDVQNSANHNFNISEVVIQSNFKSGMQIPADVKNDLLKERKEKYSKEKKENSDHVENIIYITNPTNLVKEKEENKEHVVLSTNSNELVEIKEKEKEKRKENKIKEKKKEKEKESETIVKEVVEKWNEFAQNFGLSKVYKITERRKSAILARMSENEFNLDLILDKIAKSDFLRGLKTDWRCDFDFVFLSAHNYVKILEGKYDNRSVPFKGQFKDFGTKLRNILNDFRQ